MNDQDSKVSSVDTKEVIGESTIKSYYQVSVEILPLGDNLILLSSLGRNFTPRR